MKGNSQISKCEFAYFKPTGEEKGVLVLCPGINADGSKFLNSPWAAWAQQNKLGIIGATFVSDASQTGVKGYYYMNSGSGKLLLEGITKIYGKELPLYLFGFSGGAHFVSRFVEWRPQGVQAWCAYSAGWWTAPKSSSILPNGIVACGKKDERYKATLEYFNDGRKLGKPWLFISMKDVGHEGHEPLNKFVREYFEAVLLQKKNGQWVELSTEQIVSNPKSAPAAHLGYLPSEDLLTNWQEVHFLPNFKIGN